MAKLTLKLKQHTPLIHFEHDVDGATLRATELKPKLDKFLTENVFKWNYEKFEEFLIGDKKKYKKYKDEKNKLNPAFDYKVKINVKKDVKRDEKIKDFDINNFKLYFGNMGDEKNKEFSFYENIEIEFFSFKSGIIEKIKEILPKFFFVTNFGTRQGKGFGSFFINYKIDIAELEKDYDYKLETNSKNVLDVFKEIDREYKKIRNGGKYAPKIQEYFERLGINWEKIKINQELISKKPKNTKAYLVKDLLGLSTNEDWKKNGILNKENVQKVKSDKNLEEKIERFQSPIFFKILKLNEKYTIYIKLNEIKILNKDFRIFFKENNEKEIFISTPENFDLKEFFEFIKEKNVFKNAKKVGDK